MYELYLYLRYSRVFYIIKPCLQFYLIRGISGFIFIDCLTHKTFDVIVDVKRTSPWMTVNYGLIDGHIIHNIDFIVFFN